MMRRLLAYPLTVLCLSAVACSSADDLEKRLANNNKAANSQSSVSPTQTATLTSTATATQSSIATNSSTNTAVQSDTDATVETSTEPATNESFSLCPDGDSVKLHIPDPLKACWDESRLYNFEARQCTAMRKASFDCNFDAFFQKLRELGLEPSNRLKETQSGTRGKAIILGCGESATRDTVLIQFIISPQIPLEHCVSPGVVFTGCYGKDSGPSDGTSNGSQIIQRCMNGIQAP